MGVPADLTAAAPREPVEIRRSARRRRTVSAYREDGRIVVLLPDTLTPEQEQEWVRRMVARVAAPKAGRRGDGGDAELAARAAQLSRRYLDGLARPTSVRWVAPMRSRWASCTPQDGTIRVSRRAEQLPEWVSDYLLVHELAHLLEPGHGPRFWELVGRYPRTERARGYLAGLDAAAAARE